jgi:hypothetical protein
MKGGNMGVITDIKNRVIYITRPSISQDRIKNIYGEEPEKKGRERKGRLKYGVSYSAIVLKRIQDRTKLKDGKGKFWKVIIKNIGEGFKPIGFGKASQSPKMGRIHRIRRVSKYVGIVQSSLLRQGRRDTAKDIARRKLWSC